MNKFELTCVTREEKMLCRLGKCLLFDSGSLQLTTYQISPPACVSLCVRSVAIHVCMRVMWARADVLTSCKRPHVAAENIRSGFSLLISANFTQRLFKKLWCYIFEQNHLTVQEWEVHRVDLMSVSVFYQFIWHNTTRQPGSNYFQVCSLSLVEKYM